MPDIFLSYNREDQAVARRFAEAFAGQGFDVWWDATLKSGEAYDEVTETALRTAKAVVVLWSPRSVVSRWVRAEATLADRNKTLVPCTIEPCDRPIMFELTQTAELSHWQGEPTDKAWLAFLGDVRRLAAKDVEPVVAVPAPELVPASVQESPRPGQSGSAPSLAVLPFTNRSGLPEDEVFAIGMVEDLIDALSQGVNVRVLASSATARFRTGTIPDLAEVGRQLGVRYLLEGNLRRIAENLRVTAQLVEAASSAVLWTQKFERPLNELGSLQEDLVLEVAAHLDSQVQHLEMARALKKPADLTAWEAVTRSISTFRGLGSESVSQGLDEARRAVAIAPDYGLAHAMVAVQLGLQYWLFFPNEPKVEREIRGHIDRALALETDNAVVLGFVGQALNFIGQPLQALQRAERAIRLSPSYGYAHFVAGLACGHLNRLQESLDHLDADSRTAPGSNLEFGNHLLRAFAHIRASDWDAAITAFDRSLALNPDASYGYLIKATILGRHGPTVEALELLAQARRAEPEVTLAHWGIRLGRIFANSENLQPLRESLCRLWDETGV